MYLWFLLWSFSWSVISAKIVCLKFDNATKVVGKRDISETSDSCTTDKWCYKVTLYNAQYKNNKRENIKLNGLQKGCVYDSAHVETCEKLFNQTICRDTDNNCDHCKWYNDYFGHKLTKGSMFLCCCKDKDKCNKEVIFVPPKPKKASTIDLSLFLLSFPLLTSHLLRLP